MKVVVWSALGRLGTYATGVGKHVLNMTCGLAARRTWEVRLLLSTDLQARERLRTGSSKMDAIPEIVLPFSRSTGEALWRTLRRPALDRWLDGADWLYCPKELYVPVRQARYAVTVHDLYRLEPEYRRYYHKSDFRWRRLLVRSLQEADLVLSVSEFTKRRLVELIGLDPGKIRVVGNGVDERYFSLDSRDSAGGSTQVAPPYLLSVGGVTVKKGALNLLAVASELALAAPDLTWIIAGPVEPQFAKEVAAASNIQVMQRGFPDAEMRRLVQGASAMLILSEYEGFGIPALEAMAAGVPVVAADRAALPEVIGEAGVLVEPSRTDAVVEVVLDLLHDRNFREQLVSMGRVHAVENRWSACVDRLSAAMETFGEAGARLH